MVGQASRLSARPLFGRGFGALIRRPLLFPLRARSRRGNSRP